MALTEDQRREYQRRYYRENRERLLADQRAGSATRREARAASKRLHLYGLTEAAFQRLLAEQEGLCAICRQPPPDGRWHVDHDHDCCPARRACGKCVRGLLCQPCNLGIGCLGENWETLLAGALYLMAGDERRLTRPEDALLDRNLRVLNG